MVRFFVPMNEEVPTVQPQHGFPFRQPIHDRGHQGSARAGSAGHRFAGAPFPYPHADMAPIQDFRKFRIDLLRKSRMKFEPRPPFFHIQVDNIRHKSHAVWISHIDTGHFKYWSTRVQRRADHRGLPVLCPR